MRATEIIRNILDLVDQIECGKSQEPEVIAVSLDTEEPTQGAHGDDVNRFRQIFDLLSAESNKMYSNSPAEVVAGIESVTTHAGGGWNGPKNPADIRADSVSMYPNYQHRPGE